MTLTCCWEKSIPMTVRISEMNENITYCNMRSETYARSVRLGLRAKEMAMAVTLVGRKTHCQNLYTFSPFVITA